MGLIRLNLRRILNLNFLFMSIVASILGAISLGNMNGNVGSEEMSYFWIDIKYLATDGYIALFIFFAGEISKDLLQREKLTKRLEWKIANGISIRDILLENTVVLWLGTLLLLSPLCVIMILKASVWPLGAFSGASFEGSFKGFTAGVYFAASSLLYAAFINIAILWLKDMNRFRSIPVFITAGHILIMWAKYWLYGMTGSQALLILFPLIIMLLLTAGGFWGLTKERIVSSYY